MMEMLTPAEASGLTGVPAVQLIRWAWEDWDIYTKRAAGKVGPKNSGTRGKPMYRPLDVVTWRRQYESAESQDVV